MHAQSFHAHGRISLVSFADFVLPFGRAAMSLMFESSLLLILMLFSFFPSVLSLCFIVMHSYVHN